MEIVFDSHDYATLRNEAETLGFVDDEGNIVTNGTFESGGGWFLNVIGDVYEPILGSVDPENPPMPVKRDGYWGRLRLNGQPQEIPSFSSNISQYVWSDALAGWTKDGITVAPDWVATIGLIA